MKNPIVYITPEAKQKLDLYIALCKYEISGIGQVERIGLNDFLIEDVFLFKQEVDQARTDLSQKDLGSFLTECVKRGGNPEKLKLWFHSHVNMDTYWSGIDDDTIEVFDNEYMISIVGNKKGEYRVRIDLYSPFRLTIDKADFRIYEEEIDQEVIDAIKAEILEKVTYNPPAYTKKYSKKSYKKDDNDGWVRLADGSWMHLDKSSGSPGNDKRRRLAIVHEEIEEENNLPCDSCSRIDCHNCDEWLEWLGV